MRTLLLVGLLTGNLCHAGMMAPGSFRPQKGKVEFVAVGKPALLKIKGNGETPSGLLVEKDGEWSGEVKISLKTLETGIAMRDEHMKNKYLEVEKFPEAVLKIVKLTWKEGQSESKFQGTLTMHGQTHETEGVAHVTRQGPQAVKAEVDFQIHLSDFKVEIPSYAGIKVADVVDVHVEVEGGR